MRLILKMIFVFAVTLNFITYAEAAPANSNILKQASFISATDPNQIIEFKLWLKLRNQKKLDAVLHDLYTPGSKIYHHFLKPAQFRAAFFPTKEDINKIKKYYTQQGFTDASDTKNHFYIRFKGSVSQIEKVFQTHIDNYRYHGKIIYSNNTAPLITESMSSYISGVTGLNNIPHYPDGFTDKCTGTSLPEGSLNFGLNTSIQANLVDGNGHVIVPNMTFTGFIPQGTNNTGYTPAQIQTAYGVDQLITAGTDGTGQNVVIVDACESPTIQSDANAFVNANVTSVAANDLPQLTSSNFNIMVYPTGTSAEICDVTKPTQLIELTEETLDVESFHAMAPGANIYLAVTSDAATTDVNTVLSDVVADLMTGGVYPASTSLISLSYSQPENSSPTIIDSSLQTAAGLGVSVDVSSGDCGNNTGFSDAQFTRSVNYPSSSPWVTAVGATALFLDTNNNYSSEVGWGNILNTNYICTSFVSNQCNAYQVNYSNQGFTGGTTGGISSLYAAQSWQQNAISSLYVGGYNGIAGSFIVPSSPGNIYRAVPDVSMFGENHPGYEIYLTIPPDSGGSPALTVSTASGTSLATPFFTAILALVNEQRGSKGPLGLASQYLYNLPSGALHVISNPHGMGNPISGTPNPNAFQLFQEDTTTGNLYGIIYNFDTTLTLGAIWNDVTGVGSPYAPIFVPTLASE